MTTIVDLATRRGGEQVEAAVNEADMTGVCRLDVLRRGLDRLPARPGTGVVRRLLDARTFRLTRSRLERFFLPLAERAGLSRPLTRQWVNGFEVDFYWPELGLVVETDSLTYHRTPEVQANDRLRDQRHTAAGLTCLRFTHYQVVHEPEHVCTILATVARRLSRAA